LLRRPRLKGNKRGRLNADEGHLELLEAEIMPEIPSEGDVQNVTMTLARHLPIFSHQTPSPLEMDSKKVNNHAPMTPAMYPLITHFQLCSMRSDESMQELPDPH
jgi:hypothetical protein